MFHLPASLREPSKAPLLCAGLIGYRSYGMIDKHALNIGIYGFGAAAHILIQVANKQGKRVFAFTRPGDLGAQGLAKNLGAAWVGDSSQSPAILLDAAIIFAPSGELIPKALREINKGGMVVCGGIHMSDIPSFHYNILWGEKTLRSVANLTRKDGRNFLKLASEIEIKTEVQIYALNEANEALNALRLGQLKGAAVIVM